MMEMAVTTTLLVDLLMLTAFNAVVKIFTIFVKWRILCPHTGAVCFFGNGSCVLHLQCSVEQHGGEDQDEVEDGQDAAYLTNLQLFCSVVQSFGLSKWNISRKQY